ncbi:MAG: hypothetical protein HFI67_01340 [Lachnospiraceae bacterium]|nr:hypothetical protein [Lachnospiraceae bacterium]
MVFGTFRLEEGVPGLDFSFFHNYNITHTKKAVKETVERQERHRDPGMVGSRDE